MSTSLGSNDWSTLVGIFGEGEDKAYTVLVLVVGNKPKEKQNTSSLKVKGLDKL